MNKSSNGFTLIELMIVIAIIGIIATVAIPLYQSNIVKTQLNRSVSELAAGTSLGQALACLVGQALACLVWLRGHGQALA